MTPCEGEMTFCVYFIMTTSIGFSFNYWKCDRHHACSGVYNLLLTFFRKSVFFCLRFLEVKSGSGYVIIQRINFSLFNRREEKQGNLVKRSFTKLALACRCYYSIFNSLRKYSFYYKLLFFIITKIFKIPTVQFFKLWEEFNEVIKIALLTKFNFITIK